MNRQFCAVVGVSLAVVCSFAALADDYVLPSGETDVISTNVTYATMTIAGDLTLDKAKVTCNALSLAGGSFRVTGSGASIGNANDGTAKWNVTNGVDGACTRFVGDTSGQFGFGVLKLNLDDVALPTEDGEFDFLSLTNTTVNIRQLWNYSANTARVDVTGNVKIKRPGGWDSTGAFNWGKFHVRLHDGATFTFDPENQMGNVAGVVGGTNATVLVDGAGNVVLNAENYDGTQSYPFRMQKDTVYNNNGTVTLCSDSIAIGGYYFQSGDVFGPNVTELIGRASGYPRNLHVNRGIEVRLPPVVRLPAQYVTLMGDAGGFLLNASNSVVSFEGTMKPVADARLTLRKIGAYEATVVSTNLLCVKVEEGAMRFTKSDCRVRELTVSAGARVVVDGCRLTLASSEGFLRTKVETVNGGEVVVDASANGYLYGSVLQGRVRITGGDAVMSVAGLTQKYFRFTFMSKQGKASSLDLRHLFLFGADHQWENYKLARATNYIVDETTAGDLPAGQARYYVSSATNVLCTGREGWQGFDTFANMFRLGDNGNNYPTLTSPVIDAENPDSWLSLDMHLADAANPITGYNLGIVTKNFHKDPFCYPDAWAVYASDDGVNWTEVDRRTNVVCKNVASQTYYSYYTYDGTQWDVYGKKTVDVMLQNVPEWFRFTGYKRSGLVPTGPLSLRVDAGSSLDLTAFAAETPQTVETLRIDAVTGGGTLKGGKLAENGLLDIDCASLDSMVAEFGFSFEDTDIAAFSTWRVSAYGHVLPGVTATYDAEQKKFVLSTPVVYCAESGEIDLQSVGSDDAAVIYVAAGVALTNTTALAKNLSKFGPGALTMTQPSDGAHDVYFDEGVLYGGVSNAFGTGTVTLRCGATGPCQVVLGSATADTVYDNAFAFEGSSSSAYPAIKLITSGVKNITLNGPLAAQGDLFIVDSAYGGCQSMNTVTVNAPVTVVGHDINYPCDGNVRWKGAVTCREFVCLSGYPRMGSHFFYSEEDMIGRLRFDYNSIRLAGTNALNGTVLDFAGSVNEGYSRGSVFLNGYDQTAAYLMRTTTATTNVRHFDQELNSPSTLTLTGGVAEASVSVRFGLTGTYDKSKCGRCSLVVDAGNDDFVQILTNSVCETFGTFTVKNGTLRFAGASSLTNAPSLTVAGGRLELDLMLANACEHVTNVTLGAGAALRVGVEAATPFGEQPKAELRMESDASLELPEGAAVTVKKAWVGGMPLVPGMYTGAEGSIGEKISQIVGKGTLTVLRGGGLVLFLR